MICVSVLGFLDLLTRAQCCRVDDQRGLLTKEQLELPLFLQRSLDQDESPTPSSSATDSRMAETEESGSESTQSSAGKSTDSKSEGKNLKETAV